MPEIQSTKTTLEALKEIAGEYHIIRAGHLAGIRILDRSIRTLETEPHFVSNYDQVLNEILDYRSLLKKNIEGISRDIEILQLEIEKEKYSPGKDSRSLAQRLYSILGHI